MTATIAAAGCVSARWVWVKLDLGYLVKAGVAEWWASMLRRYGPHGRA